MTIGSATTGWVYSRNDVGADSAVDASNEVYDSVEDTQRQVDGQARIPGEMMKHSGTNGENTQFDPGLVEMVGRMIF